jgi:antagonist of KipI
MTVDDGSSPRWQSGLFGGRFLVEPDSDRVGIRLRAEAGSTIEPPNGDRPSAGTTVGTVQVPPDGNPVVLMADHATLGGYPVAAVVITADIGELARCRPGEVVVFDEVEPDEAATALRSLRRAVREALVGHYPTAVG